MSTSAPNDHSPNDTSPAPQLSRDDAGFLQQVGAKSARKLRAQRDGSQGIWFGLGMSGLIGWSVAVPTLLGAMAGIWLDKRHSGVHSGLRSWTLTLLVAGLVIGCLNAWRWVAQEGKAMHNEPEDQV